MAIILPLLLLLLPSYIVPSRLAPTEDTKSKDIMSGCSQNAQTYYKFDWTKCVTLIVCLFFLGGSSCQLHKQFRSVQVICCTLKLSSC